MARQRPRRALRPSLAARVARVAVPATLVGVTAVGRTAYAIEGKIGYMMDPKLKDQSPDPFVIHAIPLPAGK